MASRRSPAASHSRSSISAVSRGDTYLSETHCKLRRSAAVGEISPLIHLLVPRSGTDHHPQHHSGCVCPPSGNYMGWKYRTYPQLRCFAACSGFHDIGPAPRNPQFVKHIFTFIIKKQRQDFAIIIFYTIFAIGRLQNEDKQIGSRSPRMTNKSSLIEAYLLTI